jgi:hypothetical protein
MIITLSSGHTLQVDDADAAIAAGRSWQAQRGKAGTFYAAAVLVENGKQRKVYLHRLIMQAGPGQRVDHIDGNGLNNRRDNLRICSNAENMRNMRVSPLRGSSIYKGVSWNARRKKWRAYIVHDGRQRNIGYFTNESDAARAYDAAAVKTFGSFANLNLG